MQPDEIESKADILQIYQIGSAKQVRAPCPSKYKTHSWVVRSARSRGKDDTIDVG